MSAKSPVLTLNNGVEMPVLGFGVLDRSAREQTAGAVQCAIANGYRHFHSGSLNYDPKWHLRQSLDPVDLYVRHTSGLVNAALKRLLPIMEPTRADPILPNFANYRELWD